MKTTIALLTIAFFLTACGKKEVETPAPAAAETSAAKDLMTDAKEEIEAVAEKTQAKAEEVVEATKEVAEESVAAVKEKTTEVVEAVEETTKDAGEAVAQKTSEAKQSLSKMLPAAETKSAE